MAPSTTNVVEIPVAKQHNILVILGHPAADSLCAGLARAYAEGARHAGAQVQFLDVGQLAFNPVFEGYGAAQPPGGCRAWSVESENRPQRGQFLPDLQPHSRAMGQKDGEKWTAAVDLQPTISKSDSLLEPDLLAAQADITWAHHLVWVYPIWWGAMPALLKGFIDRVLLPGYAFKYRKGSSLWDKLLAGRSAELLVTMDSPPWYFRWVTRMPGHHQMKKAILEFCGIRPVRVHSFGPVRSASAEQLALWVEKARQLGQRQGARAAPGQPRPAPVTSSPSSPLQ